MKDNNSICDWALIQQMLGGLERNGYSRKRSIDILQLAIRYLKSYNAPMNDSGKRALDDWKEKKKAEFQADLKEFKSRLSDS